MYDMTKLKTRYFDIKLKNGKILNVEPPKLKVLRKIASLSEVKTTGELTENDIKNLTEAVSLSLSKNKQNHKITPENVEENYDIDEMVDFMENYFDWVNSIQNSKN